MSNLQNETLAVTSYGKKAVILAVLTTAVLVGSAVLAVYGMVCPTSAGICLPTKVNTLLSGASVVLVIIGTLLALLGILAAVESIAISERTNKCYVALAILMISAIGISGGIFQFVVLKLVGILFR